MEITYKILRDQQEYGPATLNDLQSWINEGRVGAETQVARSDEGVWRPASQFAELVWNPAPPIPASTPAFERNPEAQMLLNKQLKSGADWFFWIAGLSVINTISSLSGSSWGFTLGLAVTQVIDAIAHEMGSGGIAVAIVLDLVILGLFVLFGILARRGKTWSFIIGMVLYGLDALLCVLGPDWLGLGFHVLALFFLFTGLKAARELKAPGPQAAV